MVVAQQCVSWGLGVWICVKIDRPAQHLVPFHGDSEPIKLGRCRIPERIIRGVSVT
jgi:hypothetical protein